MNIYFDHNYPKDLVTALQVLHSMELNQNHSLYWDDKFDDIDKDNSVVFIFDRAKKNIEITTDKQFQSGYKIFAFRSSSTNVINDFDFSLHLMHQWSKILNIIEEERTPFVFTFTYQGNVKKAK